jgi:hypothetical protein
MKRATSWAAVMMLSVPAAAAEPSPEPRPAAGVDFFYSGDSDGAEVVRAGIDFDLRKRDEDHYIGVRLEKAQFNPQGTEWHSHERIYLRAAGSRGDWQLRARVGTDGHTVIGSIAANDHSPMRKEIFLERDIVETRQGLTRRIYSTFAGATIDLPLDDRNVVTNLVGVQTFSGDNTRYHWRSRYIRVLDASSGLSAQLRARYFRNSRPREFDYYSPRWYAEVLPVLQMRRFLGGWELVGAGGIGRQRDSSSRWRPSHFLHARFRSPAGSSEWAVNGAVTYTNTPSITAASQSGYSYMQVSFGASRRF